MFTRKSVFDRDGNGYITRDELQIAMEMMQETVTEIQVNEMLQLADLDKDGKINYEGKFEYQYYSSIVIASINLQVVTLHFVHFRIRPAITINTVDFLRNYKNVKN